MNFRESIGIFIFLHTKESPLNGEIASKLRACAWIGLECQVLGTLVNKRDLYKSKIDRVMNT